jgi:hypothetical protein
MPTAAVCDLNVRPAVDCVDGWNGYADGFFGLCRGCHTAGYDSAVHVTAIAASIRLVIETGAMPAGMTLSAEMRRRALTWLSCAVHGAAPPTP